MRQRHLQRTRIQEPSFNPDIRRSNRRFFWCCDTRPYHWPYHCRKFRRGKQRRLKQLVLLKEKVGRNQRDGKTAASNRRR
ncbi:hypothetical protein RISK_006716 [Rhodopirellula islandica]|uniref:Uncharacterized protein n=1 Tax=Rhodopirellula islandica TaxID=595434 RepID=A0A0J1B2Z5_RHOIS|nr:hypothetical protein RISK_006716 [Rhodopirellula islandica]